MYYRKLVTVSNCRGCNFIRQYGNDVRCSLSDKSLGKVAYANNAKEKIPNWCELKKLGYTKVEEKAKAVELKIEISSDNAIPAFAGFVSGSAKKGKPKIVVNFKSSVLASADSGLDFYEMTAVNVVHEMIHVFQEIFKRAFSEEEVEDIIDQARAFLDDEEKARRKKRRRVQTI